jgi:hypothetical protein
MDNGERKSHGYGGIDGIAALSQDVDARAAG